MNSSTESDPKRVRIDLDAELVATPRPYLDGIAYTLEWHIEAGGSVPMPAGVAELRVPTTDFTAAFDYSDPSRLVRVVVPFGDAVVGESDDDDLWLQLLSAGRLASVDDALLRLMFGDELVRRLHLSNRVAMSVASSEQLVGLGRIALSMSSLERRGVRMDGLWSMEIATLVHGLGSDDLGFWFDVLVRESVPAAQFMDESWIDWLNGAEAPLHQLFVRARSDGMSELGPLASALDAIAEQRVLEESNRIIDDAAEALSLRAVSSTRSARPESREFETGIAASDDLDLLHKRASSTQAYRWSPGELAADAEQFGLANAEFRVDSGQLHVRVERADVDMPISLSQRVMVRASTRDGDLVASASGLRESPDDRLFLSADLLIPESLTQDDVTVVIGRKLPFRAVTSPEFEHLELVRNQQEVVDADRLRQPVGEVNGPFVAEVVAAAFAANAEGRPAVNRPIDDEDESALSGARSIAMTLGRAAEAAAFERRRRRLQTRLDELSIPELDYLAAAAARSGDRDTARVLAKSSMAMLVADM
jgi:hypothetical protein